MFPMTRKEPWIQMIKKTSGKVFQNWNREKRYLLSRFYKIFSKIQIWINTRTTKNKLITDVLKKWKIYIIKKMRGFLKKLIRSDRSIIKTQFQQLNLKSIHLCSTGITKWLVRFSPIWFWKKFRTRKTKNCLLL